jgi:predicted DNA-binding ribbon-helix-helix protein
LRKDRPDLHARVLDGELTAHAAMVEAGARSCVAHAPARAHASRMTNSRKPRKHAASVHFDEATWAQVVQMAERERRPISQLLRNIVSDAVEARGQTDMVASWP